MNDEFDEFLEEDEIEEPDLELAQIALDRGDNLQALDLAEEYLESHPLEVEALNICAVAASNLGDEEKALALYRNALRLDSKNGAIHHNFGVLLERLGEPEQALTHFRRSLELQPDFPEAYINMGNVLDDLGRTEEALQMYDQALRRMPDAPDAYYNQGYALNRLGRYAEAVESFEKALRVNPGDAASLNGLGFALAGVGRDEEAIAVYGRAIHREAVAIYFYNRGLSLLRLERFTEALADFDAALERDPDFFDALIEKAGLLVEANDFPPALQALERAEALDPDSPEPPFYRGVILEKEGELEPALVELEESLRRDPDSIHTLNNKGNILIDLGRIDEALACFDAILARTSRYPLAHYNRACAFARKGMVREAVRALGNASSQDVQFLEDARTDPDFDPIRHSHSFARLVGKRRVGARKPKGQG